MMHRYFDLLVSSGDDDFDQIYPDEIQKLAFRHWTPIEIAKKAADYLVTEPGTDVLDIGSGAGKFCLVGAASTCGNFTGVEQREHLVSISSEIAAFCGINNVRFVHANVTEISFSDYDAFYFYNSFHENIDQTAQIDDQIRIDTKYYQQYSLHVERELSRAPVGTRLVTYWSRFLEVPRCFRKRYSDCNGLLNFWEKIRDF